MTEQSTAGQVVGWIAVVKGMQIRTSHFGEGLLFTVTGVRLPLPSPGIRSILSPQQGLELSQPRPIRWLIAGILKVKDDRVLCNRKPGQSEVATAVVGDCTTE